MSQAGQYPEGLILGAIETLTGNSGGAIGPDGAFNVNVVGVGDVTVVGTGGTNTLTVTLSDALANQFDADAGSAVPSSSILNIVGGTNVTTSAAGNTVTINAAADLDLTYTAVNTTPYVVLGTDQFLGVDSSGGARQINLPNAPGTGRVFNVKDSTGSAVANNITITTVGGVVTIDGSTTFVMNTVYESINVIYNGSSYEIF